MKAISLLLAAALIVPLCAQNPGTRPLRTRGGLPPQEQVSPEAQLPETNLTISLEGTTTTGSVIDLQLTGVGPTFMADQMIGEDGPVLTCQYTVTKDDKGYRVAYSIGVQLRIATSVVQGEKSMTNYQYRDVSLSGTVLCAPGVPVVIVRNAKKPLQLTVAEVPSPPAKLPGVESGNAPAPESSR